MPVLNEILYQPVVVEGKKAVNALKENDFQLFENSAEKGWELFPDPKASWNQAYNYAKMVLKGNLSIRNFSLSKKWLDRLIEVDDNLNLAPEERSFLEGKYYFETEDYLKAMEKFKITVSEAKFRSFEGEDPKYLDFYRNPEKYIKS